MASPHPFLEFSRAETLKEAIDAFETIKSHEPSLSADSFRGTPLTFFELLKDKTADSVHIAKRIFSVIDDVKESKEYGPLRERCASYQVLIVGAGLAGLRTAIECSLIGCSRVTVVEKRTTFSRNNVLHMWPFVVNDLKALGAKEHYGKFAVGGLDHLPIWRIQIILLKIALILGVQVLTGHEYLASHWDDSRRLNIRARLKTPQDGRVDVEFNVLVGSEGERSKVAEEFGFAKKDLQFGQAIGITANFALSNTQAERDLKEGGFISYLNKEFFEGLKASSLDLENLVYYRSDTNYFVFTAKKESLAVAGVFKEVKVDSSELCAGANIEKECLERVARKVATLYGLPEVCDFAPPHGSPAGSGKDVALFDFSKKTVVRTPSKVIDAPYGTHLVVGVVGDAAINPFWPQGTGAAHALLSSLDFCWFLTDVAPHLSLHPGSTPSINSHSRSPGTTSTPDPNTPFHPNPDIAACLIAHDRLHSLLQTAKPDNIKKSVVPPEGSPRTSRETTRTCTIDPSSRYIMHEVMPV